MDQATYRKQLTEKTIESVSAKLDELSNDDFFELLRNGGELTIKTGKAPNGQDCEIVAIWDKGSDDFNFVGKSRFEARGEAGTQKLPASKVSQVVNMVN